ncbi:trypsin-2 [Octopus bimaculoides]|uniref:Peptidase S1 domain-containing protein n=1 Tax=Octopus bimaculoides TaxID=37653 RepID=A0A0L8HQA3_OCTBM|nr:trypsin-2 [Octopus bimaculoides]|eukprot:XP_014770445.1 PREDICTED: trypsin-2-like [Octopus bimaculoides]
MISICFFVLTLVSVFAAPPRTQIVEGDPALFCEMPSLVFLKIYRTYMMGYRMCGGTLISPSYVITAAHCFEGLIDRVEVNLGSLNKHETVQNVTSTTIFRHENYTRSKYLIENDIGLLRLEKPLENVECVFPVDMAAESDVFDNKTCIIAGWGRTGLQESSSDVLLKAAVPVVPIDECRNQSSLIISNGFICAGDYIPGGASICKGDSGGPLICPHENNMVLAGVISHGLDCHKEASLFTSIAYYREWIDNIMNSVEQ